jgi:hypothetical protein
VKIQLLSDLHLEVDPAFEACPAPDADVLVLAGDIGGLPDSPLGRCGAADWHLGRFSPRLGHWPVPVVYVPGNHEYDGQDFDQCRARLRAQTEALGIHWLDGAVLEFDGIRFVGTTLWSDFDCFADRPSFVPGSMTHNLRQRLRCFRAADYFLVQAATQRDGRLFDAAAMREVSLECQAWLRAALTVPHTGPTVVVTHFAPSLRSHDPRYGLVPGTAGFCNALDDLVPAAALWLHGHLHCASDYWIGDCRVIANPLGYAAQGEQRSFDPQLVIEI